ncbi:hypothetical protein L7F22_029791 [Adiantum nelumboides]|nr:hypothetical protein [Adiantum nelumboides]
MCAGCRRPRGPGVMMGKCKRVYSKLLGSGGKMQVVNGAETGGRAVGCLGQDTDIMCSLGTKLHQEAPSGSTLSVVREQASMASTTGGAARALKNSCLLTQAELGSGGDGIVSLSRVC